VYLTIKTLQDLQMQWASRGAHEDGESTVKPEKSALVDLLTNGASPDLLRCFNLEKISGVERECPKLAL